jgi:hypothetical protein
MLQLVALRSTIVVFIGLAVLHLFLFNDLFEKIHSLRSDIIIAIREQALLPIVESAHVASPTQVASKVQTMSPKLLEDAEKWNSLVSMTSMIPQGRVIN